MNKKQKIGSSAAAGTALIIIVIIIMLILLIPSPRASELGPNTYIQNSSVDNCSYAVAFGGGNIVISDSLTPTTNLLNGNPILNSTVNDNSNINNESRIGSICLYGSTSLTLRNIIEPRLDIFLYGFSSLTLENCKIHLITVQDSASITVKNSTVLGIYDYINNLIAEGVTPDTPYDTSISISDNSIVSILYLTFSGNIQIRNSTFIMVSINSILSQEINYESSYRGSIENSSIGSSLKLGRNAWINLYGSTAIIAYASEKSHLIANQSSITLLYDGIIAYGDISIDSGIITGVNYENTSQNIGSSITSKSLYSIAANNTANVTIKNTTALLYTYDTANMTIFNSTCTSPLTYSFYTHDASLMNLINFNNGSANLIEVHVFDDSTLMMHNVSLNTVNMGSSGNNLIENSTLTTVQATTLHLHPVDNLTVINSTVNAFYVYGSDTVKIENCTILTFYEGIVCSAGSLTLNDTTVTGTGTYYNQTTLINNIISVRVIYTVETIESAILTITNRTINQILKSNNTSKLFIQDSTFSPTIKSYGYSEITLSNCSGATHLYTHDTSKTTTNQNSSLYILFSYQNSENNVRNSTIYQTCSFQSPSSIISESTINQVYVYAHGGYVFKLIDSTVKVVTSFSWGSI